MVKLFILLEYLYFHQLRVNLFCPFSINGWTYGRMDWWHLKTTHWTGSWPVIAVQKTSGSSNVIGKPSILFESKSGVFIARVVNAGSWIPTSDLHFLTGFHWLLNIVLLQKFCLINGMSKSPFRQSFCPSGAMQHLDILISGHVIWTNLMLSRVWRFVRSQIQL